MNARHSGVCAVIVTHRPDRGVLRALLVALRHQAGGIVIVDNSGDGAAECALAGIDDFDALLPQKTNIGLAGAQNIGIAWARAHAFEQVILLDQDSRPSDGMVETLLDALRALSVRGRVAAVGPRIHDTHEGHDAPFIRVHFPWSTKLQCRLATDTHSCDFLISSGSLIPLSVLEAMGGMDERLFIDNIDLEWCFRALSMGYTLHGICAAVMQHRLGDARWHVPGMRRGVVVHPPLRLYYMMRNRLLLYRLPHVPWRWVAQDVPRVLVKLVLFGVLMGPRRKNLHCMLRGLWDGMRGRAGPAPGDLAGRDPSRRSG
jgi:rhamnosyltransferase